MLSQSSFQVIRACTTVMLHCLVVWQAASMKHVCVQALMWWSGKTVGSVFGAWVAAVERGHRLRLCKARALFSYSNMLQRKALHSWRDAIAYKQARQERLALVFQDLADRRLCLAFDAWYASASITEEVCVHACTNWVR